MPQTSKRWPSVLLLTAFLSVIAASHSVALAQTSPERTEAPAWPLPPLDAAERQARLRLFTRLFDYDVETARPPASKSACTTLLQKLSMPGEVKVLEPAVIATSRGDPAVPHSIVQQCPRIEFDRVWWSNEKGLLEAGTDQAFAALPLGEKDKAADYYYAASGPIEFYDLSTYFESRAILGSFTESAVIKCNNATSPLCRDDRITGYRRFAGVTIGPVVDVATCASLLPPKVKVQSRLMAVTEQPQQYYEKPNLFAYVDIDGELYRLSAQMRGGSQRWAERFDNAGGATIILEKPSKTEPSLCVFLSKSARKE